MPKHPKLTKLDQWLQETGRKKTWFARAIGYSYQGCWCTRAGVTGLTEQFVLACFRRFPDMPPDIFKEHGYVRDGDCVYKQIPLHPQAEIA